MRYRGSFMVSSLIFSHGPRVLLGAGDCTLARESVSKNRSILYGILGHKTGGD